ncbi:MAG: hypothetical protein RIQ89_368 [Bacteroidota bacterium]
MLDKKFHDAIYAIYGFVRFADEIVDSFHHFDKQALLDDFKSNTFTAIRNQIHTNPVLQAFQWVVNEYNIPHHLIDAFLNSMYMDLDQKKYDQAGYNTYIYGSAEVVGLMCLKVFCEKNETQYDSLTPSAKRLGAAFQKINFLRDINSDFNERGRTYFPNVDFNGFDNDVKAKIEADIQLDFDAGYEGIKLLPNGARLGVTVAYVYYLALFKKIKSLPASNVQQVRIRVTDTHKLILLIGTYLKVRLGFI